MISWGIINIFDDIIEVKAWFNFGIIGDIDDIDWNHIFSEGGPNWVQRCKLDWPQWPEMRARSAISSNC